MPWEDYLGTQLPARSRLPPNFKTFDFFDETTGIATSAKTLDTTTAAKLSNPSKVYSSLKGNIDAAANFSESGLKGVTVTSKEKGDRFIFKCSATLKASTDGGSLYAQNFLPGTAES